MTLGVTSRTQVASSLCCVFSSDVVDSGSKESLTIFRTCLGFREGTFHILKPPLVVSLFANTGYQALACWPLIGLVLPSSSVDLVEWIDEKYPEFFVISVQRFVWMGAVSACRLVGWL